MGRVWPIGNAELDDDHSAPRRPDGVLRSLLAGAPVMLVDRQAASDQFAGIIFGIAALAGSELTNLMAKHGRGILSVTIGPEDAFMLGLAGRFATGRPGARRFMNSVEAAACDGTGISAADRALTMRALGRPGAVADDLVCPGHIAPLLITASEALSLPGRAHSIVREAGRFSGAGYAAAAWCDVLGAEGGVASLDHCLDLACRFAMPVAMINGVTAPDARTVVRQFALADVEFGAQSSTH